MRHICEAVEVLCERSESESLALYVFGSYLDPTVRRPRDLDLLLTYPEGMLEAAVATSRRLRGLAPGGRIDVTALSRDEELETQFIKRQRARQVWPTDDIGRGPAGVR